MGVNTVPKRLSQPTRSGSERKLGRVDRPGHLRSSKHHRWILPPGIWDGGLTFPESLATKVDVDFTFCGVPLACLGRFRALMSNRVCISPCPTLISIVRGCGYDGLGQDVLLYAAAKKCYISVDFCFQFHQCLFNLVVVGRYVYITTISVHTTLHT